MQNYIHDICENQAIKDVNATYDVLGDLFELFENFLRCCNSSYAFGRITVILLHSRLLGQCRSHVKYILTMPHCLMYISLSTLIS